MEGYHQPVLLEEVLGYLQVEEGKWFLDCTLGDGGHTLEILKRGGNVVGIDQDPEALKRAKVRIREFGDVRGWGRFLEVKGNFGNLRDLVNDKKFNGVLMDLGVSSLQLDKGERGFSFSKEARLDMRMDPGLGVSAFELINGLNKGELVKLFQVFGEFGDVRVVNAIIREREQKGPIETTTELAGLVERAVGGKHSKIHPATLIFQALRMAVNDELNNLKTGLQQAEERLNKNGVLLVISFHSLEDRVVKNTFSDWQDQGLGEILTRKPIIATEEEVRANPRARSAKLRAFRKK
jgi:16S rRNA (cytosine1402-N4)-methyltransferase